MPVHHCGLYNGHHTVAYGGGIFQKTALRPPNLGGERPVMEQADLGEQGVRLEQGFGSEGKAQNGNGRHRGNNEEGWTRPRQRWGGVLSTHKTQEDEE